MRSVQAKREEVNALFVRVLIWSQLCLMATAFAATFITVEKNSHAFACCFLLAVFVTKQTAAQRSWKAALVEHFPADPFGRYPFWATVFCLLRRKDPDRILGPKYRKKK